jgi:hypothetical protein
VHDEDRRANADVAEVGLVRERPEQRLRLPVLLEKMPGAAGEGARLPLRGPGATEFQRPELTFRHHRLVAKLGPAEHEKWLAKAVEGYWTTRQLAEAVAWRAAATHRLPAAERSC